MERAQLILEEKVKGTQTKDAGTLICFLGSPTCVN